MSLWQIAIVAGWLALFGPATVLVALRRRRAERLRRWDRKRWMDHWRMMVSIRWARIDTTSARRARLEVVK